MTFINTVQFVIALFVDSRYEKINLLTIFYLSWYSTIYWLLNALVAISAFPKALRRKKERLRHGQVQTEEKLVIHAFAMHYVK